MPVITQSFSCPSVFLLLLRGFLFGHHLSNLERARWFWRGSTSSISSLLMSILIVLVVFSLYVLRSCLFVTLCSRFSFHLSFSPSFPFFLLSVVILVTFVMNSSYASSPSASFSPRNGSRYSVMEYISRYAQYLEALRLGAKRIVGDQPSIHHHSFDKYRSWGLEWKLTPLWWKGCKLVTGRQ